MLEQGNFFSLHRIFPLICLSLMVGCMAAPFSPPHILVVGDKAQLGGCLGAYFTATHTIYLAPGADEAVYRHEWLHAMGAKDEIDH